MTDMTQQEKCKKQEQTTVSRWISSGQIQRLSGVESARGLNMWKTWQRPLDRIDEWWRLHWKMLSGGDEDGETKAVGSGESNGGDYFMQAIGRHMRGKNEDCRIE